MKIITVLMLFLLAGCTPDQDHMTPVLSVVNYRRSIKLKGPDPAIVNEIARDSAAYKWQSLVKVYRLPPDTDLKDYQPSQPGNYQLAESAIVFTPDTPFIRGQAYFVRYYLFGQKETSWDLITGKKKPGNSQFIEFNFRD